MSDESISIEAHQLAIKQVVDNALAAYGKKHGLEVALEIMLPSHWQLLAMENSLLANRMPYVDIAVKKKE